MVRDLWNIPQFADHNFTSDHRPVTHEDVWAAIRQSVHPKSASVPPVFDDVFPFTMSHICYEGFRSTYPFIAAQIDELAYCEAKLDQFVTATFSIVFPLYQPHVATNELEEKLNQLPAATRVFQLQGLDWRGYSATLTAAYDADRISGWKTVLSAMPGLFGAPPPPTPPPPTPPPPAPDPVRLGQQIRAERLRRDLPQKEVADRLGISQPHLSRIETGERDLETEDQKKLALAFLAESTKT
jgi:hypothetical protein